MYSFCFPHPPEFICVLVYLYSSSISLVCFYVFYICLYGPQGPTTQGRGGGGRNFDTLDIPTALQLMNMSLGVPQIKNFQRILRLAPPPTPCTEWIISRNCSIWCKNSIHFSFPVAQGLSSHQLGRPTGFGTTGNACC
jgi:hypothetical protein